MVAVAGAVLALIVPFAGHDRAVAQSVSCAPLTIAGDDPNATGDQWGFHEGYYAQLRSMLTDTTKFGPSGTVKTTFTIGTPVGDASGITGATPFAGRNVFFSGATYITTGPGASVQSPRTNYTPTEQAAIRNFVLAGGAAVIITNKADFGDAAAIFGFTTRVPNAFFDPTGVPSYPAYRAPAGSVVMTVGTPFQSGDFGTVSNGVNSPGLFHTVSSFTGVPAGWLVAATANISNQANGDNNIPNLPVLAYMRAGGLGAGSGPVVVSSDLDLFSNAYDGVTNNAPNAANQMLAANQTLTLNTFAWLANQMCGINTRPVPVGAGTGTVTRQVVAATPAVSHGRAAAPAIR